MMTFDFLNGYLNNERLHNDPWRYLTIRNFGWLAPKDDGIFGRSAYEEIINNYEGTFVLGDFLSEYLELSEAQELDDQVWDDWRAHLDRVAPEVDRAIHDFALSVKFAEGDEASVRQIVGPIDDVTYEQLRSLYLSTYPAFGASSWRMVNIDGATTRLLVVPYNQTAIENRYSDFIAEI